MANKDPVKITSETLRRRDLLTEAEDEAIHAEAKRRVNVATDTVDAEPYPDTETMFDHVTSNRDEGGS
jgi:TPP-dependent pyruvate/acetoin dehydrogenase alpha subunit